jgi:hypothetical protein
LRHELWCAEVWSDDQGSASLQVKRPLALVPVLSTDCHRPAPHAVGSECTLLAS